MSIYDLYNNMKFEIEEIEKDILLNIKNIIKKTNPKNIHELFYIYCYLLMKGYLSKNKYYEYSDIEEGLEIDHRIFDEFGIYEGKGVCRHNATNLNKILRELNINSNFIELNVKKIEIENLMDFKPNIGKCLNIETNGNLKYNHANVFVETEKSNFILDPTNLCELEVLENRKLYCPFGNYIINDNVLNNLSNKKCRENNTITKNKIIEYYKSAKDKIIKNKSIIEDFYKNNEENYEKISKKLEYFKLSY